MKAVFPPFQQVFIDPSRTVGDLEQSLPGAAWTFEALGIDFHQCQRDSLREAVAQSSLSLDFVLEQLTLAASRGIVGTSGLVSDCSHAGLVVAHIVSRHHVFTRGELLRLAPLAAEVVHAHAVTQPVLLRVGQLLEDLARALLQQMAKEEQVLFPYISRLVAGEESAPSFGSMENFLRTLHAERERVVELLQELEIATDGYRPPVAGSVSCAALYAGFKGLQEDLRQHGHMEDNVLFPAARQLERRVLRPH